MDKFIISLMVYVLCSLCSGTKCAAALRSVKAFASSWRTCACAFRSSCFTSCSSLFASSISCCASCALLAAVFSFLAWVTSLRRPFDTLFSLAKAFSILAISARKCVGTVPAAFSVSDVSSSAECLTLRGGRAQNFFFLRGVAVEATLRGVAVGATLRFLGKLEDSSVALAFRSVVSRRGESVDVGHAADGGLSTVFSCGRLDRRSRPSKSVVRGLTSSLGARASRNFSIAVSRSAVKGVVSSEIHHFFSPLSPFCFNPRA